MKTPYSKIVACCLWVACSGCSQDASLPTAANAVDNRATADGASVEGAPRESAQPDETSPQPSGNYSHVASPEKAGKCDFEERDPAERPRDFVPANFRSNVIFYQRPKGPLWSHVYADGRAIAEVGKGDLFVAARLAKPDLWIRPTADGVTLEAGTYRLACY